MANTVKKKLKKFGRYMWELFKSSILPSITYCCVGLILMAVTMQNMEKVEWGGGKLAVAILCVLGAACYQFFVAWATGGNQYEMLVSGNVTRTSVDAYGNEYKMSLHKEAKEYRVWKGFAIGGFVALLPLIFGILWGVNQVKIDGGSYGTGIDFLMFLSFFLAGWAIIPFYCKNMVGGSVSYFFSLFLILIPIVVSGVGYIVGAYARRNKALRLQVLEDRRIAEEEARAANKKINYGGLPGTQPKKRK